MAAEFSFVRIRRTRLEELLQEGDKRAKLLLQILDSLDTYLSATQLGITLSSLALGWMGEPAIASLLTPVISQYFSFVPPWFVSTLAFAVSFSIVTFFQIVLGELVPRSIALQKVELVALNTARPVYVFYMLIYPLVQFFNKSAHFILRLLSISPTPAKEIMHSQEELRMLVSASERGGVLDRIESQIIDNVFEFSERMAREIMVPRQDVVCLYEDCSFEENIKIVRESVHTRYPVCKGDKDNTIGMVHMRGIVDLLFQPPGKRDLKYIMRELVTVPAGMSVAAVLQTMQAKHAQIAVVADEYGGMAGIVTIEDLLEEIVGDIQDEYDQEEEDVVRHFDGSYELDGLVLLDAVEELFNIKFPEHDEDTLGGYVFGLLGRRPEIGDKVVLNGYEFEVRRVKGFRVQRVSVSKLVLQPEDKDVE